MVWKLRKEELEKIEKEVISKGKKILENEKVLEYFNMLKEKTEDQKKTE